MFTDCDYDFNIYCFNLSVETIWLLIMNYEQNVILLLNYLIKIIIKCIYYDLIKFSSFSISYHFNI